MKFKRISTRMLAVIVPILVASMAILTIISVVNSSKTIDEQIENRMTAELKAAEEDIENSLNGVSTMSTVLTNVVAGTYRSISKGQIENMLGSAISENDMVLGSGLWFEPHVYSHPVEYFGPYVFKNNGTIETTYDYSSPDYDYFSQEYYQVAKASKTYTITDPYYDQTSGMVMSTCSAPMFEEGAFIGCVTVDMELSSVQSMVNNIKVGKNGTAMMLDSTGVYLAGVEDDKISNGTNISADSNTSLAKAGAVIMANDSGMVEYTSAKLGKMDAYYTTIPTTGWKVIVQIPQKELQTPIVNLMLLMIIIAVVFLVIEVVIVILQVSAIAKNIRKVNTFAGSLAEGDFSVDPIEVRTADELGTMSESLNDMYDSNRDVISTIADYSIEIDDASKRLNATSQELLELFTDIQTKIGQVNEDMMTTSAASEQVNASSEEVLSNVNLLAGETEDTMSMSQEIKGRATEVESQSRTSFDKAQNLTDQYSGRLEKSIENAKVVEKISAMADVISNIADEINLLSLNASIEAARAGEAGKGFAVVAMEIGNLAGSTTEAVTEIQDTISQVQNAFSDLTGAANGLLDFVQNTVAPDYKNFVEVAGQYGKDAESFEATSVRISEMAGNIKSIMSEVTEAIQSIAEATQETTDISNQMTEAIDTVSENVNDVASMSESQQQIADTLTKTVGRFKLTSE